VGLEPAIPVVDVVNFRMPIPLLFAVLVSACGETQQTQESEKVFDESSINDVWHKAKLRGVAFRAIGQEPGWLLEITNGIEILLVTDYGEHRTSYPYVEPIVHQEERRTEFITGDDGTIVEIRGVPCRDSMSGEEFEVSVTIKQTDRELQGCGRALF
jgi:uncharacterized membrane protein